MDDAVTHGEGRTRFTDFRMTMKTNMPVFKVDIKSFKQEPDFELSSPQLREVSVRRRYSEFKWLRDEVRTLNTTHNHVTTHLYALLTFSDSPDLQSVQVTRTVQINVPNLPGKALTKQLPFLKNDDGENFNNCSSAIVLQVFLRRSSLRNAGRALR